MTIAKIEHTIILKISYCILVIFMICSFQSCNTDELIITYTPQLSLRTVGEYKSIDTITIEGKQYQLYNPYKFAG